MESRRIDEAKCEKFQRVRELGHEVRGGAGKSQADIENS